MNHDARHNDDRLIPYLPRGTINEMKMSHKPECLVRHLTRLFKRLEFHTTVYRGLFPHPVQVSLVGALDRLDQAQARTLRPTSEED